jgi:hypothetical protein
MLGNIVKRFEWPLVRKLLHKGSPLSIHKSLIFPIRPPDVPDLDAERCGRGPVGLQRGGLRPGLEMETEAPAHW